MAAASIIMTLHKKFAKEDNYRVLRFTCVADSTDGTFTAAAKATTELNNQIMGWNLYKFQCVIGATAPTAASGFTLKDANGVDLFGAQGAGRITGVTGATTEDYPKIDDQAANQPVVSTLTFLPTQADAKTNSATFIVDIFFKRVA